MCGIAGMAGIEDRALLDAMLDITSHRGPDDHGTFLAHGKDAAARIAFGNNRLKILDLTAAGHQPMFSPDGQVAVVYNGELFNFRELREELEADGVRFQSHTDTEVLPHLYQKYGVAMVERLNGMFAIALWDASTRTLMLARDRMGVKPLYYAQCGGKLYFASEIKALLLSPDIKPELNASALGSYLSLLYVPNPETMFEGIAKLEPASMLLWRDGTITSHRYWTGSEPVEMWKEPESVLVEQCREILKDSVRRQLISDVPVGFFLSGGLDSSTLLACASQVHAGELRCYSIAFKDEHGKLEQSDEDAIYARIVAERYGAKWHQIVAEPDVVSLLPRVIWHLDDAVADHAAIATLLICEAAKPEVTVLLSGQGADEIFAGYRVHVVHKLTAWLRKMPRFLREQALGRMLQGLSRHPNALPGVKPGLALAYSRFAQKLIRLSDFPPQEQYLALRSYLDEADLNELLLPDVHAAAREHDEVLRQHFVSASELNFIDQLLYVDQQTFLPDLNLTYSDKLSMAASIEARVPFLDNAVVDFMRRVPPELKIKGRTQKYLLKQAMGGILPNDVVHRRKAGFGLPVRSWLRNELREMIGDLLSEERLRSRGLFNPATVQRMLRHNEEGIRDYTLQIWGLLTLELWQQEFIDRNGQVEAARKYKKHATVD